MNKIGEKVRRFRLEKRMTEKEVAEKMGISQNAYHKKEMGESNITVPELLKLSQIFDEPVEEILKDELAICNIQYNSGNGDQSQFGRYEKTSTYERKLWEDLLAAKEEVIAAKDMLIQKQAAEIELLQAEVNRLKTF